MKTKRKLVSLILTFSMLISMFTGISLIARAGSTVKIVDASATNWTATRLTASDVTGGAGFTGDAGTYGNGAVLNTKVDVSGSVEFDLKFTKEEMATDSCFGITFGTDTDSFNQPAKGITYLMYKKAANVIQCGQNPTGAWTEYPHQSVNSYRFVKGTDGWELYLKTVAQTEYSLIGKVSFATFGENAFFDGKAYFGVYVYDSVSTTNEVAFEVTNVKYTLEETETEKTTETITAPAANWDVSGLTASDVTGGAGFTGDAGTYGNGAVLNTKVDISESVEFDLKFTKEEMATDSCFGITFGTDTDSFNQPAKGITYLMYKKAANVIQCGQNPTGAWTEYPHQSVNSYRFVKGTDGWELYLKTAAQTEYSLIGKVSFTTFGENAFSDGKAYFGVYVYDSVNTTNEVAFEVTNIKHVVSKQSGEESDVFEPVLDAYDLATYTEPYWKGDTVYNESVMIVKNQDGSVSPAPLLYPATEIISVRSSDLKTVYEKGKDWNIENGKLVVLENSSIPFMTYDEYYPAASDMTTVDGKYIYFSEGTFFHNKQIAVTYKHESSWNWSIPGYKGDKLPKTVAKLKNNEALKIVFYGDSITTGANSSSKVGASPNAATWMTMFEESLKKEYKNDKITSVNTAVGGMASAWGVENVKERVVDQNPDLLIIGFGMNDGNASSVSAETYRNNISAIIQAAKAGNPNVEILLVSPMLPNPEVKMTEGNQASYEAELLSLETEGVAAAPVTTMYQYLMKNKRYYDMTGNNVNHPNDFVARLYAQVLNATLIYSEPIVQLPYPEKTFILPTNDAYWECTSNSSVSNGIVTLNDSGVASYTGSKLTNRLAEFKMEATIPSGKWIALMARQSDTGKSPWDQKNVYFVTISDTGQVLLNKYQNGQASVVGEAAQTDAVKDGVLEKTTVRFGTIEEEDGIRIILDIAGKNVLNVLDTDPIKTNGFTGFVMLETANAKIYTGPAGTDSDDNGELTGYGKGKGYLGGEINPAYIVKWPVITDYLYIGLDDINKVLPGEISDSIGTQDKLDKINADGNVDVVVSMTEPQTIDKSIFEALAGKDKHFILKIVDEEGNIIYSISFYGKNLEEGKSYQDFNPTIRFQSEYEKNIAKLTNQAKISLITFTDELPGKATVKVNLKGKYDAGTALRLYDYDAKDDTISLYNQDLKVSDALYAAFETGDAKIYFLTDDMTIKAPVKEPIEKPDKDPTAADTASDVGQAVLMFVISALSAVGLLFVNKKFLRIKKQAR